MTTIHTHDRHSLVELRHLCLRLAASDEDIRGRSVRDPRGADLGTIDDLLIDPVERRVRLPHVRAGGIWAWEASPPASPSRPSLTSATAWSPWTDHPRRTMGGRHTTPGSSSNRLSPSIHTHMTTGPHWPYRTAGYPYPHRPDRDH